MERILAVATGREIITFHNPDDGFSRCKWARQIDDFLVVIFGVDTDPGKPNLIANINHVESCVTSPCVPFKVIEHLGTDRRRAIGWRAGDHSLKLSSHNPHDLPLQNTAVSDVSSPLDQ